eukprot:2961160-Rhodomonas_salina.2
MCRDWSTDSDLSRGRLPAGLRVLRGAWELVKSSDMGGCHEDVLQFHGIVSLPLPVSLQEVAVAVAPVAVGGAVEHNVEVVVQQQCSHQAVGADLAA